MLRKFQGEPLKLDHVLPFCQASFCMTLSRAGFLTLAPDSFYMSSLGESPEEKILGSQYWEYFLPLGNWLIFSLGN